MSTSNSSPSPSSLSSSGSSTTSDEDSLSESSPSSSPMQASPPKGMFKAGVEGGAETEGDVIIAPDSGNVAEAKPSTTSPNSSPSLSPSSKKRANGNSNKPSLPTIPSGDNIYDPEIEAEPNSQSQSLQTKAKTQLQSHSPLQSQSKKAGSNPGSGSFSSEAIGSRRTTSVVKLSFSSSPLSSRKQNEKGTKGTFDMNSSNGIGGGSGNGISNGGNHKSVSGEQVQESHGDEKKEESHDQQQQSQSQLPKPQSPDEHAKLNDGINNNKSTDSVTKKKRKKKKERNLNNLAGSPSKMRRRRKLATIDPDCIASSFQFQQQQENGKEKRSQSQSQEQQKQQKISPTKEVQQQPTHQQKYILPPNQYECVLRRRAIVKEEDKLTYMKANHLLPGTAGVKNADNNSSTNGSTSNGTAGTSPGKTKRRTFFSNFQDQDTSRNNYNENSKTASIINATNDTGSPKSTSSNNNNIHQKTAVIEEEIYGDTTLGMKLTILSGKVIVQSIIPLSDGRASPAQLSGYINRGDVILSINNKSLILSDDGGMGMGFGMGMGAGMGGGANISSLVDRLSPLSNPRDANSGLYDREVKIRFEVGAGLNLLEKDTKKEYRTKQQQQQQKEQQQQGGGPIGSNVTATTPASVDGATDLFNLNKFTFVDQLSGQPMFDDDDDDNFNHSQQQEQAPALPSMEMTPTPSLTTAATDYQQTPKRKNESSTRPITPLSLQSKVTFGNRHSFHHYQHQQQSIEKRLLSIGYACSVERVFDVMKFSSSGYFLLNEDCSSLLRESQDEHQIRDSANTQTEDSGSIKNSFLSPKEMIIFGKRVLLGANLLLDQVENGTKQNKKIDPLKMVHSECRSFSSKSRFSQRSRFRQKTNFMLQRSNHSDFDDIEDDESSSSSSSSSSSEGDMNDSDSLLDVNNGDIDGAGGDEMLLRLAVWNNAWKSQMIHTLDAASVHKGDRFEEEKVKGNANGNAKKKADGLELQLQNLFFGEQVTDIISKKKSSALPPDEITEVLYDLALSVSSTVPMNVNFSGDINTSFASIPMAEHDDMIPPRLSSSKKNSEIIEATRFLLDDILPTWLDTFRPMQMQQRRVLWPLTREVSGNTSIGTPDDLSIGSSTTGWSTNTPDRKGKLEDRIASLELDAETRTETCYLITFYFKRKILSQLQLSEEEDEIPFESAESNAVEFIEKYGSYLNLYEALNAASDYFSKKVIEKLLDLASNDPVHNDCMKLLSRSGISFAYEPKMLSCLLAFLPTSTREGKSRSSLLAIIVAGYPDLKPWQIRTIMLPFDSDHGDTLKSENLQDAELDDVVFYYEYLSLLMESSHMARSDKELVREWCFLSTTKDFDWEEEKRREHFFGVALLEKDGGRSMYVRDLPFLIDTSIEIKEYPLTLNLANEIITNSTSLNDHDILIKAVQSLHNVARECLKEKQNQEESSPFDSVLMRQILVLFNKIASSPAAVCKETVDVCVELGILLDECQEQHSEAEAESETASDSASSKEGSLLSLISETMAPSDTLQTLSNRSLDSVSKAKIVSTLRTCLKRGAEEGVGNEISTSLLRLSQMRPSMQRSGPICNAPGIWKNMLQGTAIIDK